MRVAIITEVFLPKIDGVVNRTLNLIRHLPRYGDELLVVCPSAEGLKTVPFRFTKFPASRFYSTPNTVLACPTAAWLRPSRISHPTWFTTSTPSRSDFAATMSSSGPASGRRVCFRSTRFTASSSSSTRRLRPLSELSFGGYVPSTITAPDPST